MWDKCTWESTCRSLIKRETINIGKIKIKDVYQIVFKEVRHS